MANYVCICMYDNISDQSTLQKVIDYFYQRWEFSLLHMTFHRSLKLDTTYHFNDKIFGKGIKYN